MSEYTTPNDTTQQKVGFKGLWLPASLVFSGLSLPEERMLSIIDALDYGRGCNASNGYLSKFMKGVKPPRVSKIISSLKEGGHIQIEYEYYDGTAGKKARWIKVISPLLKTVAALKNDPYITEKSINLVIEYLENNQKEEVISPLSSMESPPFPEGKPPFPQRKAYIIEDNIEDKEEEKIYKKSEDELFTPPPGGGLSGPNDYSVKDQEEEGRDGERKMGAAASHPARGDHGNDVKTLIYETVVNFYEGWVARYGSHEVRGKVTRTYAGKPTKLVTQIKARCKRLGKQAIPSFQAVIASKCEYFAEMGMWKNINPQTILQSKFDEYMGRAIDEGWLDETGFNDLAAKATVPPALSPEAEWYQKPGFNIPELDMNELAPDLQKMFIHRQRQWAAVNNNVA
jgi:hypothetical protein